MQGRRSASSDAAPSGRRRSPIEAKNVLLTGSEPLTNEQKAQFAYFGEGAHIKPPYRILNPHRISIGDRTSIQEYSHINAFQDLSFLQNYISPRYRDAFRPEQYRYDSHIHIGRENQVGRFFFVSCTNHILLEDNVLISERVFLGDNNHSFDHPDVPIMQQPNRTGEPIVLGRGSWVGVGAVVLPGTHIGPQSVVGANSVCKGVFPSHSVIATERAKLLRSAPIEGHEAFGPGHGSSARGIEAKYSRFYAERSRRHVYPVEFVVRVFLGTYPNLKMNRERYAGSRILDLGFGDGRNMPLLDNLGFAVYGVEISEEILALTRRRLADLRVPAQLQVGRNASIPFDSGFFHYALACHSCYYVDKGDTFDANLSEVHRVLAKDGIFVCSLPFHDTYILKGAKHLPGGHYEITHDPYGLRKGTVFRAFQRKSEVEKALRPLFTDISVGYCDDDFFGIHQKVWIAVCKKK